MAGGKLKPIEINRLPPGNHGDGDGLYLRVSANGNGRSWAFRFKKDGKAHWISLGTAKDYLLTEARQKARECRRKLHEGVDLLTETVTARRAAAVATPAARTFGEVAAIYIKAHRAGWRNAKHAAQWEATLSQHAASLTPIPVAEVGVPQVLEVLEAIWTEKPETASRVRGRIEAVLDYARARHWRAGENPARWRGHLDALLPPRSKVATVEHFAALPWAEIGAFLADLAGREADSVAAIALRFTILTAARSAEVLGATWSEIDLDEAVWTVPASRMKAGREHRVPLSAAAVQLLKEMAKLRTDNGDSFVFPGKIAGKGLSSMALAMVLRRMGRGDLTVHGFRSTFRDWCSEATNYDRETAEAALAHTLRDKVEAAYRRGDRFEKRRRLMDEWAEYCARPAGRDAADVVPIRAAVAG